MKIYAIKNCDTVKKALTFLDERGVSYEFHDYKKLGISKAKLEDWCKQVGWQKLLKQTGPTWNKIGKPLAGQLDQQVAISLMLENQSIIVRPLVEVDGTLTLLGFNPAQYAEYVA
jgi:arsenate reductase (glutaredoxin)